jgi:hypothetical protein
MSAAIVATKILYPPTAHCSRCDWHLEDVDASKMRRETRKHVAKTAHSVWIDWNTTSRYDYVVAAR